MGRSTPYGTIARLIGKFHHNTDTDTDVDARRHFVTIDLHALIDTMLPLRHMFLCSVVSRVYRSPTIIWSNLRGIIPDAADDRCSSTIGDGYGIRLQTPNTPVIRLDCKFVLLLMRG
jgi:hypothetical protein